MICTTLDDTVVLSRSYGRCQMKHLYLQGALYPEAVVDKCYPFEASQQFLVMAHVSGYREHGP